MLVGDLVSCYSRLLKIGNTSVRIGVEVEVERAEDPDRIRRVAEATITYVALTPDGKPRKVPRTD